MSVDSAPSGARATSYTLTHRKLTPKGNLGQVESFDHIQLEEVEERLLALARTSAWVYVQQDEIDFPGNSHSKPKTRVKEPKKR